MRERAREEAGGVRGMVVGEKELALQQRVAAAPIERASTALVLGQWCGQGCTLERTALYCTNMKLIIEAVK